MLVCLSGLSYGIEKSLSQVVDKLEQAIGGLETAAEQYFDLPMDGEEEEMSLEQLFETILRLQTEECRR